MRTVTYEDLYFHVITLCSLDVTVNFWVNDFQPPGKNGPYAYVVVGLYSTRRHLQHCPTLLVISHADVVSF